jgi:4-hydroxybenzoate polyprenyltransferase
MTANRLLDAAIDLRNPRTAGRAIPSGRLQPRFVLLIALLCGGAFVAVTAMFGVSYSNWLPVILSVPVLLFISAYPLLKRFTRWVHFYLGAALGLAPVCAWIAIAGRVDWPPLVMGVAVLLWTAGFDILYACQDRDVDVRDGLHSIPAKLGIARALWLARASHLACLALLLSLKWLVPQFGSIYLAAWVLALLLLVAEHLLVRADDLSRINLAFFTLNGCVSVTLGILGVTDVVW